MIQRCAAFRAALFSALFAAGVPAAAQDVTLTSRDGAIELSGTLLGFDGEFYRVDTAYGELTVDGSGVLCDGAGCPSLTDFVAEMTLSGSTTLGRVLMPALVEAFALRRELEAVREETGPRRFTYALLDPDEGQPLGRFSFHLTTTDEGFADLMADDADAVMALREIRPAEVEIARQAGMGVLDEANRSRVIALDAMVPVVAPSNPVADLSLRQLARLLGGRISNWSQLGGPDAPVVVHVRDARSGLAQGIEDRILAPAGLSLPKTAVRHETTAALADAVADDPFAFGIASVSETGFARVLPIAGPCGFELEAHRLAVKTEDYPLTAPMFLYLPARRMPALVREFLSFTRSDAAQIVIRRAGFVDQSPEEVPLGDQGDRFANAISVAEGDAGLSELKRMVATLRPMQRLSTSFRFEPGSARLDAQSRSNVYQLAHAIEAGRYDTRRLMFVGFSDGVGPASANLDIARQRAAAVRDAVIAAAETADLEQVTIGTDAFGEAMPMACDDTSWGRQANRRVEVWVR
ncbi:phosphate ABC transporter substrate-binding/OmpA family protein [Roseivivax marinus]|uniref:phosphate ABC transporter substrate-binding/OmpA family protein n=1 Tax=Roseivivax marinus TaxID=1379903 RepID=UPI001F0360FB|nr:phosphate ABC transporter substrate-binding/OmpA family protein [Roseivivax marinus]UMA64829.1 phosphate ABC transporter substrate-binding/OmpA family protein [Roseivivax marinus]